MLRQAMDRLASLIAACVSAVVSLVPAWAAHMSIAGGLMPQWVYAPIAGLVGMGAIMVFAFLRKMRDGIGPLRERRR